MEHKYWLALVASVSWHTSKGKRTEFKWLSKLVTEFCFGRPNELPKDEIAFLMWWGAYNAFVWCKEGTYLPKNKAKVAELFAENGTLAKRHITGPEVYQNRALMQEAVRLQALDRVIAAAKHDAEKKENAKTKTTGKGKKAPKQDEGIDDMDTPFLEDNHKF
jgi:hypothetical protein